MNAYQSLQYDQMLCNAYDDMTVLVFKTPGVLQPLPLTMQSLPTDTCEAWPQSILMGLASSLAITALCQCYFTATTRCTHRNKWNPYKQHSSLEERISYAAASIFR